MKEIPLTQEKVALVSDEDYLWVIACSSWYAYQNIGSGIWYAARHIRHTFTKENQLMHRFIMNPSRDMMIDHINGDGLDNRRENLRICTAKENMANKKLASNNTTGYKGVVWYKRCRKWFASVGDISIGYFDDIEEAARAYDAAAKEMYGEFARLNFPSENG